MTIYNISQVILNWYHENGRKNLPWQKNKTLYTVWISEIMLQQTTVKSVIPYFKKFMLHFPDMGSLITSQLDEILHLWSGLGYYNRAKNIYKSSKIISKKYNGKFPDQFSEIIELPGIGKSTAGAILSLSLNFFYPILDGNVKRILIRYYGIIGSLKDKKIEKKLWYLIDSITPIYNTGKFNQAMMDIGSSICIPMHPKCTICPLMKKCVAEKKNKWENYPLKNTRKKPSKKISWFILIQLNKSLWLEKNIQKNIWNNLFCLPSFDTKLKALQWLKNNKLDTIQYKILKSFFHKFSHFILHIHPILIELSSNSKFCIKNNIGIWYNYQKPQRVGLPKPVQNIIKILQKNSF